MENSVKELIEARAKYSMRAGLAIGFNIGVGVTTIVVGIAVGIVIKFLS